MNEIKHTIKKILYEKEVKFYYLPKYELVEICMIIDTNGIQSKKTRLLTVEEWRTIKENGYYMTYNAF